MFPRAWEVATSLKLLLEDPSISAKKFHSVFMYRLTLKTHFQPQTTISSFENLGVKCLQRRPILVKLHTYSLHFHAGHVPLNLTDSQE